MTPLTAPSPLSPLDGAPADAETLVFRWEPVPGATTYHLQVALDDTFADPVFDAPLGPSTEATLFDLFPSTQDAYWRVRAAASHATGPWSEPAAFTAAVEAIPARPTPVLIPHLVTPTAEMPVEGHAATFGWQPVSGAAAYEIEWAQDTDFSAPLAHLNVGDTTLLTLYEMLPEDGTVHYWRVRALARGDWQPWSAPAGFTATTDEAALAYRNTQFAAEAAAERTRLLEQAAQAYGISDPATRHTPRLFPALATAFALGSWLLLALLVSQATPGKHLPVIAAAPPPPPTTHLDQRGIVDAEAGTYHIPIDQAIDLLVDERNAEAAPLTLPQ